MANRRGRRGNSNRFYFLGDFSKITVDGDSHEIKRWLLLGRKTMTNLGCRLKKQRRNFADKVPYSQSYGFPSIHVQMWELVNKEGWALKNQCFWTVVLEKTLESPLNCKEFKWVSSKRNRPWIFIERTDAEDPIIDHLMQRADSLEKTQRIGKLEGKRRRGCRELDG